MVIRSTPYSYSMFTYPLWRPFEYPYYQLLSIKHGVNLTDSSNPTTPKLGTPEPAQLNAGAKTTRIRQRKQGPVSKSCQKHIH